MISVPFTLPPDRESLPGGGYYITETTTSGIASLDDAALRLQYTVHTFARGIVDGVWKETRTDSGIVERTVPLHAIRSMRLAGWGLWYRLDLATSDLRVLEGFPGTTRGEVSLRVRRRDRIDALELASRVEYAAAQRLLAPGDP